MKKPLVKNEPRELQYIPSDKDGYFTFDLGCASAAITAGFVLVSFGKTNPHKVQFIFRREDGIEKVVDDYWADRLEVKARTYFDNTKMLKNRIYSE